MLDLREKYFVPQRSDGRHVVELRAFTHGLMPRTVPSMMQAFTEDWRVRGVDAWNSVPNHWAPDSGEVVGWWTLPEFIGDRFIAPLLDAPAGTCIHQPHAHWSVSCILSCDEPFDGGRDEVLCSDLDFPSVLHSVQQWAPLRRFRPVVLPRSSSGFLNVEALLAAISDRTALVFVSHVGFVSGELIPEDVLRSVARKCAEHGALFCIDGYHAATTMPVHVEAVGADVYFGGLLKEGSGSSGNAYLYVREGLQLTPRLGGWFGQAEPFAFDQTPRPHPAVRRRFLGGTTAVASLYHAVEGVRVLLEVGLEAVRQHSLALGEIALGRALKDDMSVRSPQEAARRGAMLILETEAADRLSQWLKGEGVYTDSRRGRYLRLAPFVWNSPEDVTHAFDAIGEALRTGAHLRETPVTESGPVT